MKQNNNVDKIWAECENALKLEKSLDKRSSEMSSEKIFKILSRRIDPLISKLNKQEIEELLSKIDDEKEKPNIRNRIFLSFPKQLESLEFIEKENKDLQETADYIKNGMNDIVNHVEYKEYLGRDVVADEKNLEIWRSEMVLWWAEKESNMRWHVEELNKSLADVFGLDRKVKLDKAHLDSANPVEKVFLLRKKQKEDIMQKMEELEYDILTERVDIKRRWKHLCKQMEILNDIRRSILTWKHDKEVEKYKDLRYERKKGVRDLSMMQDRAILI